MIHAVMINLHVPLLFSIVTFPLFGYLVSYDIVYLQIGVILSTMNAPL